MNADDILEYKSKLKASILIRLFNEIKILNANEIDNKKIPIIEAFVEHIKNFEYKGEI